MTTQRSIQRAGLHKGSRTREGKGLPTTEQASALVRVMPARVDQVSVSAVNF